MEDHIDSLLVINNLKLQEYVIPICTRGYFAIHTEIVLVVVKSFLK